MTSTATFRFLGLCCGPTGQPDVRSRLLQAAEHITSWQEILRASEDHGLEPLLRAHLDDAGVSLPAEARDHLQARWMQHAHAARVRADVLASIADAFDAKGIPFIVLKGAALAALAYADPRLRPMRDLDLLVRASDADEARAVLDRHGFHDEGVPVVAGYHHLQGMSLTTDGATITVELHHELLRASPFVARLQYDDLAMNAQAFTTGTLTLHAPGREDLLWHVYAHAFMINVLRPGIRLISVADLVTAVEAWMDALDWEALQRRHGHRLSRALPLIHYLRPWSPAVLARFERVGLGPPAAEPTGVRPASARTELGAAFSADVIWPAEWWFRMRYGIRGRLDWLWHRAASHPMHVLLAAAQTGRIRMGRRASRILSSGAETAPLRVDRATRSARR